MRTAMRARAGTQLNKAGCLRRPHALRARVMARNNSSIAHLQKMHDDLNNLKVVVCRCCHSPTIQSTDAMVAGAVSAVALLTVPPCPPQGICGVFVSLQRARFWHGRVAMTVKFIAPSSSG